jgi:MazG family protein
MEKLRKIVARLRKECPWDREQTVFSMRRSVIEEAYELAEAIRERDYTKMREEIGDHLFVALFLAQIMEDTGKASFREITEDIIRKLINRHPHIFGAAKVRNAGDVLHNWDRIKEKEKGHSILKGVPKDLPALHRAESIQQRARRVGFDWKDPDDVPGKVVEEVGELKAELRKKPSRSRSAHVQEEFGDLLFALVNMARHLGIDAEDTLQRASTKFTRRFQKLEQEFARRGKRLEDCSLKEMDAVWEQHKRLERRKSKGQRPKQVQSPKSKGQSKEPSPKVKVRSHLD